MDRRLGSVARSIRLRAELDLIDIAIGAGVSQSTLTRFEQGNGWRWETNQIVAAYASAGGVTPADVWRAALEMEEDDDP